MSTDYQQHALDTAWGDQEDRRAVNRAVIADFRAECAERRELGIYDEVPRLPPADWEAAHRAGDRAEGYTPACPGCDWPYDPAKDEHQAECCPACRAEDAANGE